MDLGRSDLGFCLKFISFRNLYLFVVLFEGLIYMVVLFIMVIYNLGSQS